MHAHTNPNIEISEWLVARLDGSHVMAFVRFSKLYFEAAGHLIHHFHVFVGRVDVRSSPDIEDHL